MTPPNLPDAARTILKGVVVAMGTAGIISADQAERLVRLLRLESA